MLDPKMHHKHATKSLTCNLVLGRKLFRVNTTPMNKSPMPIAVFP